MQNINADIQLDKCICINRMEKNVIKTIRQDRKKIMMRIYAWIMLMGDEISQRQENVSNSK